MVCRRAAPRRRAGDQVVGGRRVPVRHDGTPALASDPRDLVRYITNEGTRVSRIYASLRDKQGREPHAAAALERLSAVSRDPQDGTARPAHRAYCFAGHALGAGGRRRRDHPSQRRQVQNRQRLPARVSGRGFNVPLPSLTSEVERELAPLKDSVKTELKYDHYSLKINRERRTAFFVAANINGAQLWDAAEDGPRPARPQWSFDPRMREEFQPDDVIFSSAMQRGHLYKREDAMWGSDSDAKRRADEHSFTITNATPMIANFNNVEWGDLEDIVTRECDRGTRSRTSPAPSSGPAIPSSTS